MKKLVPAGRRAAHVALAAATVASIGFGWATAFAADHRDGDAVQEADNIPADINDVFAFVANDKVVLGMTVFPAADATSKFSDAVVYVFHVNKHAAFLGAAQGSTDVLCTFDADQTAHCWIGDPDAETQEGEYIEGDASDTAGIDGAFGKARLFAGLRADPFYFGLNEFNTARNTVKGAFGSLSLNGNGCPILDGQTASVLRGQLQSSAVLNFFKDLNGLAIIIEADKDLFTDTDNQTLSVFASTHVKQ